MDYNDLSDELKAKARKCTSVDELVKLAKEEGIVLTDEQMESIAGGSAWSPMPLDLPCEPLQDIL